MNTPIAGITMTRLIFIIFASISISFATEIDSFSTRDPNLKDATTYLNNLMNSYIQASILDANAWGYCDRDRFINNLNSRMGGTFWTQFENDISSSSTIPWTTVSRNESIYQDFSFFYAPALYLAKLGPVLRIGDYYIGSDKFGHFITTGYEYYQAYKNNQNSLVHALDFGERTERDYFGLQTTGIYSYADLVANYEGFIGFWSKLIANKSGAYVKCKNNIYYQAKLFDWKKHVNAGWDEAINCNAYRNQTLESQAQARINLLEQERGVSLTCPLAPQECKELISSYGDLAPRLISPKCFE